MRLRNEAKVGLIVFSGFVLLLGVYWFLGGLGLRTSTYPVYAIFENVQKLDKGALVRMAGVKVGVVSETKLSRGNRAGVQMLIWKDNKLPKDSVARITQGGFIGDSYVEIVPGTSSEPIKPNQRLRTVITVQPEEIMKDASDVLKQLRESTKGINELIGDKKLVAMIRDTVASMDEAAKSASRLADAAATMVEQTSPEVQRILADVRHAATGAGKISDELQDMVKSDVRPDIKSVFGKVDKLLGHIDDAVSEVQQLAKSFEGGGKGLDQAILKAGKTIDTINEASQEAKQMMANLKDASGGIKDITTDKDLQSNLKALVCNVAVASEQIKELSCSLNQKFGGAKPPPTKAEIESVPDHGIAVNSLANVSKGGYRVDAYYSALAPNSDNAFYRLGAYNIGENTQLILQGGTTLDRANALRYGIYASRVGVGYDRQFGSRGLLSFDLFRPNDPNLEIRGIFGIGDYFGIYAGVQDIINTSNRDAMVGIHYRR